MRESFTQTQVFTCAKCRREGVDAPQSIDDYYIYRCSKTGRPRRSPYCKRHQKAPREQRVAQPRPLTCAECRREGVDAPQSLDDYYMWTDSKTGKRSRSKYCRRHENARQTARQLERIDPSSPKYDAVYHERRKKAMRDYMSRRSQAQKEQSQ